MQDYNRKLEDGSNEGNNGKPEGKDQERHKEAQGDVVPQAALAVVAGLERANQNLQAKISKLEARCFLADTKLHEEKSVTRTLEQELQRVLQQHEAVNYEIHMEMARLRQEIQGVKMRADTIDAVRASQSAGDSPEVSASRAIHFSPARGVWGRDGGEEDLEGVGDGNDHGGNDDGPFVEVLRDKKLRAQRAAPQGSSPYTQTNEEPGLLGTVSMGDIPGGEQDEREGNGTIRISRDDFGHDGKGEAATNGKGGGMGVGYGSVALSKGMSWEELEVQLMVSCLSEFGVCGQHRKHSSMSRFHPSF